jgi:hypothetical protein
MWNLSWGNERRDGELIPGNRHPEAYSPKDLALKTDARSLARTLGMTVLGEPVKSNVLTRDLESRRAHRSPRLLAEYRSE